ncbi:MAG: beta-lactamase family protein, partial [Chloroflexi bacterium]|nr:beta-lactamase family protein [Chloroflexota bacterium]
MSIKSNLEQRISRVENGLDPATEDKHLSNLETKNLYERMKHFNVPGVSVAVINDGKVEWTRGYGLLEVKSDLQVTPNAIFHACSMSKFVTAMVALKLVQNGVVELDDEINQKLTSWKLPENLLTQKKGVTLRHLLSHQAGIMDHDDGFGVYQSEYPLPSLLDILQGKTKYNPKP